MNFLVIPVRAAIKAVKFGILAWDQSGICGPMTNCMTSEGER